MERILFTKINDKYLPKYQLITKIIKNNDGMFVVKSPLTSEANEYISQIYNNYNILKEVYNKIDICHVSKCENDLIFDFVDNSISYIKLFNDVIDKRDFLNLFNKYLDIIFKDSNELIDFYSTKEYTDLFGVISDKYSNLHSLKVTPFDMTVNNVLIREDKYIFIDYEWTFVFPVPKDLFVYHLICILANQYDFSKFCSISDLYEITNPVIEFKDIETYYNIFISNITKYDEIGFSMLEIQNKYVKNRFSITDLHNINQINTMRIDGLEKSEAYYKQREVDLLKTIDYYKNRESDLLQAIDYHNTREKDFLNAIEYHKTYEKELLDFIDNIGFKFVIKKYIKKIFRIKR